MGKSMRRSLAYSLLVAFSLVTAAGALSACNTMAGAGQDMQSGGKALENSADKHGADR
jgi:entericidin B